MPCRLTILMLAVPLAACHGARDRPPAEAAVVADDWHRIATRPDRDRVRDWRPIWVRAVQQAIAAGHGGAIAAEGALLQPDAALPDPAPPPGDYRCRMTKLGAQRPGMLDHVAYPPFRCRVAREGVATSLTKLTGSQRPVGLLFPDDPRRMVFLGTMMLSEEKVAQHYGRDAERDMVGIVERVGPARWRLVLPAPRWESLLDVMELVPA